MTTEPEDELGRLTDMESTANAFAATDIGSTGPLPIAVRGAPDTVQALRAVVTFDEFYSRHYDDIARALAITLGDRQLGTEAADEAMTRAYARWKVVGAYANPTGWIYKVGLNWARSWHRTVARRASILKRYAPTDATVLPPTADLDLQNSLAGLDEKYRSVVVCRYLLDWDTQTTAEALSLREGTVKSRLSKGLELLRSELGESDISPPTPLHSAAPDSSTSGTTPNEGDRS